MCPPSGQYEHNMNITVTDGDCYSIYFALNAVLNVCHNTGTFQKTTCSRFTSLRHTIKTNDYRGKWFKNSNM